MEGEFFFFKASFSFPSNAIAVKKENCDSLSCILSFAPNIAKATELWIKTGSESPSGLRPWKLSPFFTWSRPRVAMVTPHLLPTVLQWSPGLASSTLLPSPCFA